MPVIKVQEEVERLENNATFIVVCSDPGVLHDIPAWCRINGHQVLSIEQQDDEYRITIRVGMSDG